jgi:glutamine amidotransferase
MIDSRIQVAIVDFGLGNLFSVKQACEYVGMDATITSSCTDLFAADAVILPGVGAYGDAMEALQQLDLIEPLQDIGHTDKWLFGICLGFQLLMERSYEFGTHKGLGIIEGVVKPLENPVIPDSFDGFPRELKVPQVGWNRIWQVDQTQKLTSKQPKSWQKTPLSGISDGEFMYFVHSYYVQPANPDLIVSTTQYGQIEFCSSLQYNTTFACQFHPERSGPQGLQIYKNIANMVKKNLE